MIPAPEQLNPGKADDFLAGGGEMGALMREMKWEQTPLGPVETWSPSLKMMTRFLLANRFPMLLWWGPQFYQLYNDAYRPVLGAKHPHYLARPVSECWSEIWHILRPLIETPFNGGPATWMEDILLEINRYGFLEETHFTIAYSPVPDETAPSGIGGVLATVHEISEKVVGERRIVVLRDLSTRAVEAKTAEEACIVAASTLTKHSRDVPFALLYLIDPDGKRARLAGSAGIAEGSQAGPLVIELQQKSGNESAWPLSEVVRTETLQIVEDLASRFGDAVPPGPWADPPRQAAVTPIHSNITHQLAGLLVVGISSRLRFDDSYRSFIELAASQIATAVANARAYEEERERAEALAELDRAKTVFFSNVSHEFRTPLTLMLGPLEDMLSDGLSGTNRERLEVAHRNSLRLLKLVNTLLDFSRIETGRIQASYEPTNLAVFTTELASVFRSAIERAGLRLIVDCPPLEELVYVDREMWEKVVLNLLSNALKFTFDGEIEVGLKIGEAKEHGKAGTQQAGISKARPPKSVTLTVRDTGTGIPADELPHLFRRFHRVKGARARTFEGSGIGLALVQELVKLHGGTVNVESEVDRGTTFTVAIPLGKSHLPAERIWSARDVDSLSLRSEAFVEEVSRWLPAANLKTAFATNGRQAVAQGADLTETRALFPSHGSKILLADDNADMRDYVRRLLTDSGYQVEAVVDGQAALQAARKQQPDLVLTDVMMPGLDGLGLLEELRKDERLKTIPVIMLSARAGEESQIGGLQAGADDYLIKPFSARELLARVGSHLKLRRTRHQWEEALRASERKFSAAFAQSPLALTITSLEDGRLVEVNDSFVRLSGFTREEVLGRSPAELKLWVESERHTEGLKQLQMGESIFGIEARFRMKNGDERVGIVGASLIEINSRPHVVSSVADITERKQAETRLALLAEISEMTRHVETANGLLFAVSQAVGEHLRVRRCLFNEIDLDRDLETIHQDYCREAESVAGVHRVSDYSPIATAEMMAGKTVVNRDSQIDPRTAQFYEQSYAPNGERAYVAVPLMREGRWVASLWVSDDRPRNWSEQEIDLLEAVAERTWLAVEKLRGQQALRESQAHLKLTTEAAQVGTWQWDLKSGELYWSEIHKQLWGYGDSPEPIYFEAWARQVDEADLRQAEQAIEACLLNREEYNVEYRITPRGTTETRWIRSIGRAVYDESGKAVSMLGVSFDITEIKQTEDLLRQSATQLALITDTAPVFIARCDRQERFRFVNTPYASRFGLTPEDCIGKRIPEVIGAEAHEQFRQYIEIVLRGEPVEFETEIPYTKIGNHFMHCSYAPEFDANGNVIGWVSAITDITERKRAEEERDLLFVREREAREEAETLNQVSLTLAGKLDLQILVQTVTDAGTKLTGAEFGAFFYNVINEHDESYLLYTLSGAPREAFEKIGLPRNTALFEHTFRGLGIVRSDDILEHPDYGKNFPHRGMPKGHLPVRSYLAVPVVSRSGEVLGGLFFGHSSTCVFTERDERIGAGIASQAAIAIDNARLFNEVQQELAQRKQAEEAVRESEERFRMIANNMAQLAWTCDELGFATWYNQRWYEYTGTTWNQMQGEGWKSVHHPEHLNRVSESLNRSITSGQEWEDTFPLRGKDGTFRWFLSRAIPIRDAKGDVVRWFGTNTDVTEQREAQEALREADRRKDEFLAMLAHELRNPLSSIRNAAQVLKLLGPVDANQQLAADVVERQTQHLSRLVEDLLDVSRISRGKIALQCEPLELATIINRAIEISRPLIDSRKHLLTVTLPTEPLNIQGDLTRLVQVVGNLLNNAAKYTEENGHIRIEAGREDNRAVIRVRDNGMGLAPELISRVFDLFMQADRSLDRSQGGLGIGLTLVRNLVEMHGGRIEARSDGPGHGSEFIIRLPVLQLTGTQTKPQATALQSEPRMSHLRVLVVEDKRDAAELMAFILKRNGHEVRLSGNGVDALEVAEAFRPHAVICDIGLPGMSGYEVGMRLRQQAAFSQTMLIALSGYGQKESRQRAEKAGFNYYLVKPVEPDALIALLDSLQPEQSQ